MELEDGDFDDSAFPAFLAGYPASAVTDYADDTASALVGGGATPGDSSTCTDGSSIMKSKLLALSLLAGAGAVNAATDTAPIVAAGTDIAAVLAVIFGVMVAVWAAKLIQRKTVGS